MSETKWVMDVKVCPSCKRYIFYAGRDPNPAMCICSEKAKWVPSVEEIIDALPGYVGMNRRDVAETLHEWLSKRGEGLK